ncbi:hypothetical protein TEQG_06845 [Trichophyton equinum CBS 127.97]|uniref:Uncharacterized protein n=1 Tax=Trichophyton equinum (strain ATCC MYA-4606 / CBS 127.97) TaxID=559882 RepID=F2Q149_TRIEC|nr:hypothetical protein TEQG_06845 [Trichophyton equinum CBS 127.97]
MWWTKSKEGQGETRREVNKRSSCLYVMKRGEPTNDTHASYEASQTKTRTHSSSAHSDLVREFQPVYGVVNVKTAGYSGLDSQLANYGHTTTGSAKVTELHEKRRQRLKGRRTTSAGEFRPSNFMKRLRKQKTKLRRPSKRNKWVESMGKKEFLGVAGEADHIFLMDR